MGGVTWEQSARSSRLIQKFKTALKSEVTLKNITENDGMSPLDWEATKGLWEKGSKRNLRSKKEGTSDVPLKS